MIERYFGLYSFVLALISVGGVIYFVEDSYVQMGLITGIIIVFLSVTVLQHSNQIDKNIKEIKKFNEKLNLNERLNKIETEIRFIKRGVK